VADDRGGAQATGAWPGSYRAREASDRAPFKRLLRLTGGLSPFYDFFQDFQTPKF
jgi:hypothetical protein